MRVHPTIVLLFVAVSVLALVHFLALEFFLYWYYWWLGIPVHILAGATIILLLFSFRILGISVPEFFMTLRGTLLIALAVGILWEVFEVLVGIALFESPYVLNTTTDLLADMLGGYIGYIIGSRTIDL